MELVLMIIILILLVLVGYLLIALKKEKKLSRGHQQRLKEIEGESEEEVYGKGKFSELGTLSAGITHELSNPLSIMLGRLEKLQRTDFNHLTSADFKKSVDQLRAQAERIATIIRTVRSYIYRDENEVEDFISLEEIIDNVLVFYGQRLKNHGIELRLKNLDNVFISGHQAQYEQAIINLISNSFDAIDSLDEKWIEISAKKAEDSVQIFIKDSGHGIPEEIRAKMTDPFFSTKKGKGTGLGLTLVKGIAERHGGEFKYIDDTNTTFMLQLPKASAIYYHH